MWWISMVIISLLLVFGMIQLASFALEKLRLWKLHFKSRNSDFSKVLFTNNYFAEKEDLNLGDLDSWVSSYYLKFVNALNAKNVKLVLLVLSFLNLCLQISIITLMSIDLSSSYKKVTYICALFWGIVVILSIAIRFVIYAQTAKNCKNNNLFFTIFDILFSSLFTKLYFWIAMIFLNYKAIFCEKNNSKNFLYLDGKKVLFYIDVNAHPNMLSFNYPNSEKVNDLNFINRTRFSRSPELSEMDGIDKYRVTYMECETNLGHFSAENKWNIAIALLQTFISLPFFTIVLFLRYVWLNTLLSFIWLTLTIITMSQVNFDWIIRLPNYDRYTPREYIHSSIIQYKRNWKVWRLLII